MLQDLRYALRAMRQHPWFSAAIVTTLALGIGVNTTVFTLVNAVLFKPLPFPGGDRIVLLHSSIPTEPNGTVPLPYPDLRDVRQSTRSFEQVEAYNNFPATVSEAANPLERYRGARITAGLFQMLSVQPVLGRALSPADERPGAESVAMISYGVWKDRYGRDPNVIGRQIRVNDSPAVIAAVLPENFKFPQDEDLWLNYVPPPNSKNAPTVPSSPLPASNPASPATPPAPNSPSFPTPSAASSLNPTRITPSPSAPSTKS